MQRWLERMLRRHAGAEVVGVSHGDPILILAGTLMGLPLDPERIFPRPYIEPASLYQMRFDAHGSCRGVQIARPARRWPRRDDAAHHAGAGRLGGARAALS